MDWLLALVCVPVVLGLIVLLPSGKNRGIHEVLSVLGSAIFAVLSVYAFLHLPLTWSKAGTAWLKLDMLSGFILLATALFGILIVLFSFKFMQENPQRKLYYTSLLFTLGGSAGVLLANHLLLFLLFWGFLGGTLYLLVLTGGKEASKAAQKTLIIIGGSDAIILFGILLLYGMTKTFLMDRISVPLGNIQSYAVFICLCIGAFAKAGAMPVHTWIPDVAEAAPIPVTAFLPAALDKLLGIYLLARLCISMMTMTFTANLILMVTGAVTIIAAVMMALVQKDYRKLLAYHAVSQVGYMVLGIGTGHPLGIAGGIFHMLNHSIYKACLFLCGGAVQYRTRETDLGKLGGLARQMPLTFVCFLIAALSISGIPPFNGFVSKWMIYQGILAGSQGGNYLWVIWLTAAMFGSSLTLASFMKLTHSIFLGTPSGTMESLKIREAGPCMTLPMMTLAFLCVLFGVFAYSIPIQGFIIPVLPQLQYIGQWSPDLATFLIVVGLMIGCGIYLIGKIQNVREARPFVGGENLESEARITGLGFYKTIHELPGIHRMIQWAEAKRFDIYEQMLLLSHRVAGVLRKAHTGVLTMYMVWVLIGLLILLYLFILKM